MANNVDPDQTVPDLILYCTYVFLSVTLVYEILEQLL